MTPIDTAVYEVLDRYVVHSDWASQFAPITLYLPDVDDKRHYPCLAVTALDTEEDFLTLGLNAQIHEYDILCCAEQHTTADSYALAQQLATKVTLVLRRQRLAIAPATTTVSEDIATGARYFKVEDQSQQGEEFFFDLPTDRLWRRVIRREREVPGGPFVWLTLSTPVPYDVPQGTATVSPRAFPFNTTLQQSRPQSNGLLWECVVTLRFSLPVHAPGALEVEYP
jgi:hypothetical protein